MLQICFEEGGKTHIPTPVDNRILATVEPERSGNVDIFSELSTGKLDDAEQGKIQSIG